ncbi:MULTISPECIES: beta-ribofuranosylaminobenzene 5'-phosphate synthase [unclassified Archaeoglobus]|jgi:beta-ribofuranosylaminobenzene 5'-phosphate synthase|uniref:beta-ribofuranosylaminobenzene 5'-phosphate synthase n=1 Tax=unclassified Archaeoglobus TaxID=2643606 RepID=UPI0025C16CED|nr:MULTISPECIES: beta-ribofuranosylaminobenzene 5'-phosphate synthase [unclassified Archaeoglobus]
MPLRLRTPSRIHITLIDLNGSIGRVDGGVGLALDEPRVELTAKESEDVVIKGSALNLSRFKNSASKMMEFCGKGAEINVLSDYEAHVGLGSGTQISLAVGRAFSELYGLNLTTRQIAEIMGRGGTSGIGVAVFDHGGFVVDGGHSRKEKKDFLPSSASRAKPAPLIARHDFPDWEVIIAVPNLKGFSGKKEVNLFQQYCPVPLDDVRELCHIVLMKMLPSVVEADLDEFGEAIRRIQELGFKKAEVEQYGELIRGSFNLADCIGMSSTGPAIYAVTDTNSKGIARDIEDYFADKGFECSIYITKARNRGVEIEV